MTDPDSSGGEQRSWFHSIDLPSGRTDGTKTAEFLARELAALDLPDLSGKSVLDIGAWDGFYSFTAERLGATRVVSLDHHVWGWKASLGERWSEYVAKGEGAYKDFWDMPDWLDLTNLPGRRNYERPTGNSGVPPSRSLVTSWPWTSGLSARSMSCCFWGFSTT